MALTMASYPSGKGMVCKTFMQQFDSARRLFKRNGCSVYLPGWSGKATVRLYIRRDKSFNDFVPSFFSPEADSMETTA